MLKINITGDIEEIEMGLGQLLESMSISRSVDGMLLKTIRGKTLEVKFDGETGLIVYDNKNSFFRMLNKWMILYTTGAPFHCIEKRFFEQTGVMVDASRNAVLKLDGVKELLRYMARIGLNMLMLYTEDTYEVPEYPYFGYMRGRYSQAELKELDDYAFHLGIEMIPCIQTLGHLTLALQYDYTEQFRDTTDILLVGEPKTYEFLDVLIRNASAPFRSSRIHIGMDEAHDVGLGNYRRLNGYRDQFQVMNDHLREVIKITDQYGLKPMMWSDMYYRAGSITGDYYDLKSAIPEEIINGIPDVDMVFWDYYHEDEALYDAYLQNHQAMGKKIIFAGGVWTWNGIAPNYGKTLATTSAALNSCKRHGIKEVFATVWGDDGNETPLMTILPGLQLFADMAYQETVDCSQFKKEFQFNTGCQLENFLLLNQFDETPGVMSGNLNVSAVSKSLLWQDPLLGLADETVRGLNLKEHYQKLSKELKTGLNPDSGLFLLFDFYFHLAETLQDKAEIGIELSDAYHSNDQESLKRVSLQAKQLQKKIKELQKSHRRVWLQYYKVFGWEVMDIRYGGVLARLGTLVEILTDYLEGKTDKILELEEAKLPLSGFIPFGEGTLGRDFYAGLVTAGKISGV